MSLTPDQILSAQKAHFETLFGLTSKTFEGVEKLVELNVTASRAALAEPAQHTQAVGVIQDQPGVVRLGLRNLANVIQRAVGTNRRQHFCKSLTTTRFNGLAN